MQVPVKAYSYIRMSTARQLKGDSLRRQMQQSAEYAQENGFELIDDFDLRDIGVSAFTGENVREGALKRFLDLVEQKKVEPGSYLLVESLDRLSRQRILDSQPIFTRLIGSGINIVTLVDKHVYPAYTNDISHFIYSLIAFSRANDESETKSLRIGKSWARKREIAASKKLTSWCPAWLKLDKKNQIFIEIPDRVETVRRIFNECSEGIGIHSITRRLNQDGTPTFGATSWHMSYVNKILNSRASIGEFQPHKREDGRRVPVGYPVKGYFPAVVSEDVFLRCANARASRTLEKQMGKGRKGATLSNLFTGIAKCAYCQGTIRYENKGEGPKGGRYLICEPSTRRAFGCPAIRWRYNDFETTFLSFVKELGLNELVGPDESKRDFLIQNIGTLEGRKASLIKKRSGILEMLDLVQHKKTLAIELDKIETEIDSADSQISDARKHLTELTLRSADFYESRDNITLLLQKFDAASESELYRMRSAISARIRAIVEEIIIASLGSQPFVWSMLTAEKRRKRQSQKKIQRLEDNLWAPATIQRYTSIRFKDGSIRVLLPDQEDPLRMEIFGHGPNENQMVKYHADGSKTELSPAVADPKEWLDKTMTSPVLDKLMQ